MNQDHRTYEITAQEYLRLAGDKGVWFRAGLVDVTGDVVSALFLSQALYYQREVGPKGWWVSQRRRWYDDTRLTRRAQEKARERLRALGVLLERFSGVPRVLEAQVVLEQLQVLERDACRRKSKNFQQVTMVTRKQVTMVTRKQVTMVTNHLSTDDEMKSSSQEGGGPKEHRPDAPQCVGGDETCAPLTEEELADFLRIKRELRAQREARGDRIDPIADPQAYWHTVERTARLEPRSARQVIREHERAAAREQERVSSRARRMELERRRKELEQEEQAAAEAVERELRAWYEELDPAEKERLLEEARLRAFDDRPGEGDIFEARVRMSYLPEVLAEAREK